MDLNELAADWGSRVRARRSARGTSVRHLARQITARSHRSMDPTKLSRIELGQYVPTVADQALIASVLETTIGHLFPPPATVEATAALVGIDLDEEAA